jgi:hypothetical protein
MKQFLLFLAGLIFLAMNTFGQGWTAISVDQPVEIKQTLISSSDESVVIKFEIGGFNLTSVETPRGKQSIVSVPGMVSMLEKERRICPNTVYLLSFPTGRLMDVKVLKSSYTDFHNIDIAPSKGDFTRDIDPETVPYTWGEMYEVDAFYPDIRAELQQPFIFRDFRGQVVTDYPFSYNPVSKTLRVYHELIVEMLTPEPEARTSLCEALYRKEPTGSLLRYISGILSIIPSIATPYLPKKAICW